MTREDIKKLFEGAIDDQISTLLNINTADIVGISYKRLTRCIFLRCFMCIMIRAAARGSNFFVYRRT